MGKEAMEKGTSRIKAKVIVSQAKDLGQQEARRSSHHKALHVSRLSRKLWLVLYSHLNISKELSRSQLHQPRRLALSSPDG